MRRIIFSIILNGYNHLIHNSYGDKIPNMCDYWIIIEGSAGNTGSTKWCKNMLNKYHNKGNSVDGTIDYLYELKKKYSNVKIVSPNLNHNGLWKNKDEMVNMAINVIKNELNINECFLFQVDIDEQFTIENMEIAEQELERNNADCGTFLANYWVGKNLQVKGVWGEGKEGNAYKRLWKWKNQYFQYHEPPTLEGGNGKEILISVRFNHYAYVFPEDIQFKDSWYGQHEGIYERWLKLQKDAKNKPIGYTWPVSVLLNPDSYWGRTNTIIVKVKE